MGKGYWITIYHSVSDPARLARYSAEAVSAVVAAGGRIVARGTAARTFEGVPNQRTTLIEFDSVAQAIAAYESPRYQAALHWLQGAVEREIRIVEGVD
jgi:uncharacterized protein (DUF1330 family)